MPRSAELTEKQRKFVAAYLEHGVAMRAAAEAGYGQPKSEGVRLLSKPPIKKAIEAVQKRATNAALMKREKALEQLSKLAETATQAKDRINAIALLARLQGWEAPRKHEHAGPDGGAIPLAAVPATPEQAMEALRVQARKDPALAEQLRRLTSGGE